MDRRDFLKNSLLSGGALALPTGLQVANSARGKKDGKLHVQ